MALGLGARRDGARLAAALDSLKVADRLAADRDWPALDDVPGPGQGEVRGAVARRAAWKLFGTSLVLTG